MVWLQLVRLGNPALYSWTEEYLTEASAAYRGAGIPNESAQQMGQSLEKILGSEGGDLSRARFDLADILPGVAQEFAGGQATGRVFNDLRRETFGKFIVGRRLGSPEHYRYYFAFAQPAGALNDKEVDEFVALSESDPNAAVQMFAKLARQSRPQGGVMAEVLIERLLSAVNQIPLPAVPGCLAAFAADLDDVGFSSAGELNRQRVWEAAKQCVELLLKRITRPEERAKCVRVLFTDGQDLGWLTSLLRSEIFAHGLHGDRAQPESRRVLTPGEFAGRNAMGWSAPPPAARPRS